MEDERGQGSKDVSTKKPHQVWSGLLNETTWLYEIE